MNEMPFSYLLGECKYKRKAFELSDYQALVNKWNSEEDKIYYLFSLGGFTKEVKDLTKENAVVCVTMEELEKGFCFRG